MQIHSKVPPYGRPDDPLLESELGYPAVPYMAALSTHEDPPSSEPSTGPTMERRVTQLRGDSINGFSVSSIRKENTENALSVKPSRFPLKRPIPVRPNNLSFVGRDQTVRPVKSVKLPQGEERRVTYHEFLKLDQAGPAVICSDNTQECSIVAIKRMKVKAQNNTFKLPGPCSNVVELKEIFDKDGETFMVYEQMDVSLRLINSIPKLQWNEHEIAAVCREVLCGLTFIHQGLSHYYGELGCNTVLLTRDGHVKLANIGDCVLEERRLTESMEKEDVRSVGYMMLELMEADTSLARPKSIQLQRSEDWKDGTGIKEFLAATHTMSREQLYKHPFLPQESLRNCLKPYVFAALIAAKTSWDIIAPPVTSLGSK